MSAVIKVVKKIADAIEDAVKDIWDFVGDVLDFIWKEILSAAMEFIVGLFGIESEDIIHTDVITSRMIDDNMIVSDLIVKIALEEQAASVGIIDRMMQHTQNVVGKYNTFYRYGDSTYIDGLPDTSMTFISINTEEIHRIISEEQGVSITLISAILSAVGKNAWVSYCLQGSHEYTPYNNTLRCDDGLMYVVANIDYNATTNMYDVHIREKYPPTQPTLPPTPPIPKEAIITVPLDPPARHYVVKYYISTEAEWFYWLYEQSSGKYPTLDEDNVSSTNLEMLPIVTIRNGTRNTNEDKETARYKQSKTILKFLNTDLDTMTEAITKNPDIDSVEDSFLMFGLRPADHSQVMSEVLFKTFEFFYHNLSGVKRRVHKKGSSARGGFADAITPKNNYCTTTVEGSFQSAIAWTRHWETHHEGVIGKLGFYDHKVTGDNITFRRQTTLKSYTTIKVENLSSMTFIDRQGLVGMTTKSVGDEGFFIPACYFFINSLSPLAQYELFNRTYIMVHYAAQIQHIKWYEQEEFGIFLKVLGAIITIISFGTLTVAYGLLVAGLLLAIAVGMSYVFKIILEKIDSKLLKAIVVVLYIVVAISLGAAFGTMNLVTQFAIGTDAVTAGLLSDIDMGIEDLEISIEEHDAKVEEKANELDKVREALTPGLDASYLTFLNSLELPSIKMDTLESSVFKGIESQYRFADIYNFDGPENFYKNKLSLA